MTATMRAFVMHGIGRVGFVDKPVPDPGPDGAVVRTTAALVCTTDTHTLQGAIGERGGLTLGHEAVGVVAKLGSEVRGLREGDRVVVGAVTPCFRCPACQRGQSSQCARVLAGWTYANRKDGVFADFFHVDAAAANLAPIPDGVSDEAACYCCDMLSTGLAGAESAAIPPGGTVAVIGQGPVGLMATAGARLLGAGRVLAVEPIPRRRELARAYGADEVIDSSAVDPVQAVLDLTGGEGVDSAIEAVGHGETFAACVRVSRPGGTIVNLGFHAEGENVPLPREAWGSGVGGKTIRAVLCPGGAERMTQLLRLVVGGRVDPTRMTTHRFRFDELPTAFGMMERKEDGVKPSIAFG
jgi:threonine dehydrogenase-like Zn-dependent dehydrogenase